MVPNKFALETSPLCNICWKIEGNWRSNASSASPYIRQNILCWKQGQGCHFRSNGPIHFSSSFFLCTVFLLVFWGFLWKKKVFLYFFLFLIFPFLKFVFCILVCFSWLTAMGHHKDHIRKIVQFMIQSSNFNCCLSGFNQVIVVLTNMFQKLIVALVYVLLNNFLVTHRNFMKFGYNS